MVRTVRGDRRYMVGPFDRWILRKRFVIFSVPEDERWRLSGIPIQFMDVATHKIERAYIDRSGRVWLLVSRVPYDIVKHFRGQPDLRRRLASLWCYRCCSDLFTTLGEIPVCPSCGGVGAPVIFWRDPESHSVTVGPCEIGERAWLTAGGRRYYVGEIMALYRDLAGNIYADVLTLHPPEPGTPDVRLVEVESLPEIGWRRALVVQP